MTRLMRTLMSALALPTFLLAACAGDSGDHSTAAGSAQPTIEGDIVVFAASSLTEAFAELSDAFTDKYPDASLVFNFAGSSDLVGQINEGAPADVFVSADDTNMTKLTDGGMNATDPVVIARNTFAIIVEDGNPLGINDLSDLAADDLVVVLCAVEVPCGKGAAAVLDNAGVTVTPKSFEDKVKSVVTKVSEGEADAGIVFVTDVQAAGDTADGVEIPADVNVLSSYPIAVTSEATNPTGAQAFIDFVLSTQGRSILAKYGFLAP